MSFRFNKDKATAKSTLEKSLASLSPEERREQKRAYFKSRLEIYNWVCRLWLIVSISEICLVGFWKNRSLTFIVSALFYFLLAFHYGVKQVRCRQKLKELDDGKDPDLEI